MNLTTINMLKKGQICAIAPPEMLKTAALIFDRIWVPPVTRADALIYNNEFFENFDKAKPPATILFTSKLEWDEYVEIMRKMDMGQQASGYAMRVDIPNNLHILIELFKKKGLNITPIYESEHSFDVHYTSQNTIAYQAVINNLPIVSEAGVEWQQVLEFRSDTEALSKYRNLRVWLHDSMKTTSIQHATDIINQRLEDYQWALKKHDLKTITGAISEIIDHKTILTAATAAVGTGIIAGELASMLASGLVVASKMSVWLSEKAIERKSIEREDKNRDVAIIYSAKKIFDK